MKPWLEASTRFQNPPSRKSGNIYETFFSLLLLSHFFIRRILNVLFDTLSKEEVSLVHHALLTYAQDDWRDVVDRLDFNGVKNHQIFSYSNLNFQFCFENVTCLKE